MSANTIYSTTYNTADIQDLSIEKTAKVVLDVNISAILDSHGKVTNAIIQHINITQLDLTEKELRQSEERYRLLATTIPEPIFLHQEGRFIFVNNAALKLFGAVTPEDLLGTFVMDRVHPEYRQIVMDRIGRSGVQDTIEEILLRLDGSPVNVEVASNKLIMNDKATMQVVAHDITERKKMLDSLRESEQRYYRSEASLREAQAIALVGSWTWNLQTHEVTWSDEMYHIFGIDKYSYTGRLGDVIRNVIHPDDLHVVLPSNAKSISEKPIEYRILLPNNIIRYIWAKTGDVVIDKAGNPVLMSGIAQDITERKQAEEAIQKLNEQLSNVMEGTRDVIAMLDREFRYTLFNSAFHEEYKKIYGKALKPGDSMPEALAHLPSDLAEARKHWERALGGEDFIVSQQFGDSGLERNWYEMHFSPVRDGTGQVISAVHIVRNITERKLTEEALRTSEHSLRKAQDIAHLGNWELDLSSNALKWSDEIYKLFEIDPQKFPPSYEGFLNAIHPDDRALVNDKYQNSLKTREPYHVDHRLLMKDGRIKWVHEACDTDFDAQGNPLLSRGTIQDVTERKQMEDNLRDAHWRAESIIEGTQVGTWEWNIQTGETVFNQKWAQIIGYTLDELAPLSIKTWEKFTHPEDLKRSGELLERHFAGELPNYELECRMRHKDGRWIWILDRGRITTRTSDGQPLMMFGTHQDITARKLVEERVKTLANELQGILTTVTAGISHIRDRKVEWANASHDEIFGYAIGESIGLETAVFYPDREKFERLGTEAYQQLGEGKLFSAEMEMRKKDGTLFWCSLNGRLVNASQPDQGSIWMIQDITAQKLAQEELRASEERFRSMFNNHAAVMLLIDPSSGAIIGANPSAANFYGYPESRLVQMNISKLNMLPPEETKREMEKARTESRNYFVFPHRLANGEIRTVEVHSSPLHFENQTILFSIIHDITERKHLEQELKEQRDYVTQILNIMGQGLTVTDADGRFEFVNPAYASLFGYQPSDLIGKRPVDISLPEENAVLSEQRKRRIKGQVSTYESRLIRTDGSIAHVLITGAPREIDGKYAGAIAVITDLTEQKHVESILRASEEKYRTVANFTYDWEAWRAPDGSYLYNSPSCEQISGHSAAEFNNNPDLMLEITHPDDQALLIEHQRAANQELQDQDLEIDFRIITPGGETRWITHSCTTVYSEDKHWLGRRESNRDITDRKRKEELLLESENRYRRLFETAKDGILIVDAESGMIKDVNPFLAELLGYSREQFIDKELWDIGFFKDIVANQDNFLELQQKQYIRYENLPLETFDGRKVNVEFISNVYLVDNKNVIQCNIRDITARRAAEEKIRLLNAELEQLAGTDGLTGIANHRSLLKLAEREFDVAMRYQPPLSMMFFDIDHFKQVNDAFGHAIGDEALKLTIQTVCTKLRSADLIGRYGGDEFVILLPQTSALDALPLAERIHTSIAEMRLVTNKGPLTLTISIGIAQSIHDADASDTVENLLFRADQALYAAKQTGRNRTVLFDERSP